MNIEKTAASWSYKEYIVRVAQDGKPEITDWKFSEREIDVDFKCVYNNKESLLKRFENTPYTVLSITEVIYIIDSETTKVTNEHLFS